MGLRPGKDGFLISKKRAVLGAAILVVAAAAVSAVFVSNWNPFPPKDYEDCAARAAKDAKSKDALSVLLSICSSGFKGRRKAGGGYTYYDNCQDRDFDIKAPNPTIDELNYMKMQCLAHLDAETRAAAEAQSAAQEARAEADRRLKLRKSLVIPIVHIVSKGFKCNLICDQWAYMTVEVTNRSKETLRAISVGLATTATRDDPCPQSYAVWESLLIRLSPGETRTGTIFPVDVAFSKHPLCIKVVDVHFARD